MYSMDTWLFDAILLNKQSVYVKNIFIYYIMCKKCKKYSIIVYTANTILMINDPTIWERGV